MRLRKYYSRVRSYAQHCMQLVIMLLIYGKNITATKAIRTKKGIEIREKKQRFSARKQCTKLFFLQNWRLATFHKTDSGYHTDSCSVHFSQFPNNSRVTQILICSNRTGATSTQWGGTGYRKMILFTEKMDQISQRK